MLYEVITNLFDRNGDCDFISFILLVRNVNAGDRNGIRITSYNVCYTKLLRHEYRFRWSAVRAIFRRCQLYDFQQMRWYTYREARQLGG